MSNCCYTRRQQKEPSGSFFVGSVDDHLDRQPHRAALVDAGHLGKVPNQLAALELAEAGTSGNSAQLALKGFLHGVYFQV